MRRWGQIPDSQPDAWYRDTARTVYRPDIYLQAAKLLVAEGKLKKEDVPWDSDGYRAPTRDFIDGIEFDAHAPNAYIDSLVIGLKSGERVEGANVVGGK
jgi:nitrate/nitrite transport system substrate-binding protein